MKVLGTWLIVSRVIIHRVSRDMRGDFWGWLYKRVTDPNSRDYENKILVWLLLADALSEKEHLRAVAVYEKFQSLIDQSVTPKYERLIQESIEFKEQRVGKTGSTNENSNAS